jgi:hypothetical protein
MLISQIVESIQEDLASLATLGGSEQQQFAGRLGQAVAPAVRTRLLESFDRLVAEANAESGRRDLQLRLAGDEVSLVRGDAPGGAEGVEAPGEFTARFALRLPDDLKAQIERLAVQAGLSANTWIVRALAREAAEGVSRPVPKMGRQLRGTGRS